MNYYEEQLSQINIQPLQIVAVDANGHRSNHLSINAESRAAIISWLKSMPLTEEDFTIVKLKKLDVKSSIHDKTIFINLTAMHPIHVKTMLQDIAIEFPVNQGPHVIKHIKNVTSHSTMFATFQSHYQSEPTVHLYWSSQDYQLRISMPIDFYSPYTRSSFERPPTAEETETYCRPPLTGTEFRRQRIQGMKWDVFNQLKYHRGMRKIYCQYKEQQIDYEFYLMNGQLKSANDNWYRELI
jgi:hypothetical protein